MRRTKEDYSLCPVCGRRTVLFKERSDGDVVKCVWRDCDFHVFRFPEPGDTHGNRLIKQWEAINPSWA